MNTAKPQLEQLFRELERLNPDAVSLAEADALRLAAELPASDFPAFAELAGRLVDLYVSCPFKRSQRIALDDYFQQLASQARQLPVASAPAAPASPLAGTLLPIRALSATDWLAVVRTAAIAPKLQRAIDAAAWRNLNVVSPLRLTFAILHAIDPRQAFAWGGRQLLDNPAFADPELLRDLVHVWNDQPEACPAAAAPLLDLVGDPAIARHWPGTIAEINRLVRRLAFAALLARRPARRASWQHLANLLRRPAAGENEPHLRHWLEAAGEDLGNHVNQFMAAADALDRLGDASPAARPTIRRQLLRQVKAVDDLYPALLVGADLLLARAAGAHSLALAWLGIDRSHLLQWRAGLLDTCAQVVRRLFLEDLRQHRAALDTIRRFCLGDEQLYVALTMKLDLLSRQFDSVAQREQAVDILAANYASFREAELLADQTTRHYRRLAKLLHQDSLQRLLGHELAPEIDRLEHLPAALARASEARRFLEHRRALETSVDDMLGAELDFEQRLHGARRSLIRQLLAPATTRHD